MKSIKRAIKSIALSSVLCISLTVPIFADTKNNQNVLIEIERYTEPSGGWKPGDNKEIKFAIKNNNSQKMTISKLYMIEKSRTDSNLGKVFKEMAENTLISIKDAKNNKLIENVSLSDFLAANGESSSINALKNSIVLYSNQEIELTMEIKMNENMGNDAQLLSKVFSLGTVYSLSSTGGGGGGTVIPPIEPEDPTPPVEPPVDPPINPEPPVTPPITPEPGDPDGDKDDNNNNGSNVGGSEDKLPQTGGIINGATLTVLGIGVAGIGIVLDIKSSDKGGKSDE